MLEFQITLGQVILIVHRQVKASKMKLNQVRRDHWLHTLPITFFFPLKCPGKYQEKTMKEYVETYIKRVYLRLKRYLKTLSIN